MRLLKSLLQKKRATAVQKRWFLHQKPPFVEVKAADGHTYRIHSDLKTLVMIGTHALPSPACPFPGLGLMTNLYQIMFKFRKHWALTAASFALLCAAVLVVFSILLAQHPAAGEMIQNSIWSGILLCISVCFAGFGSYIIYQFMRSGEAVFSELCEDYKEQRLLGSGQSDVLDITPDILVVQKQNETHAGFINRLEQEKVNAGHGVWVLALAFQEPLGAIWKTPTKSLLFARNEPPFQNETWTPEQKIVPENAVFDDETHEAFQAYVFDFVSHYRRWAPGAKVKSADKSEAGTTWAESIRARTAAVCLALFVSLSAFAQSADAVKTTLGKKAGEVPDKGADVSYIFEKKNLNRIGNGRSDYIELLTGLPNYRDCCHGALIAVYKDGEVIAKASAAGDVATDPMRPHQGSAIPPEQVRGFSLPDSNSMADMAEDAKRQIYLLKETAGKAVRPWWDVVIFGLWCLSTVIAVFVCGSFMVAYVTAKEGDYWGHKKARKALMYTLLGLALVLIIQSALYMNAWAFPQFAIIVGVGVETAALCWLVTAFVPNFWPSPGNAPARGGAHRFYADNNPQLGP